MASNIANSDVNYAYGKEWYKSSNIYNQNEGSPTDGIISANNYFYNRIIEKDQNVRVDLGEIYQSDSFEKVAVFFYAGIKIRWGFSI